MLESNLWDVTMTHMSSGVVTSMNAKSCTVKELAKALWASWTNFVAAIRAQFEPLSKEGKARDQI